MKAFLTIGMSFGFALIAMANAEVQLGDSRDTVYEALGQPRSYLQYDQTELLYYDRGHLEIENGVVSQLHIMDDDTFAVYQEQLAEETRKQQVEAHRQAAERIALGSVLRDKKLDDPVFMASSSEQRVAYWSTFKRKYPEVGIHEVYGEALAEREIELQEQAAYAAKEERIARLERRVAEAEERTRKAEATARVENYYVGSYQAYPSRTIYYPSSYYSGCAPSSTYNKRTSFRISPNYSYSGHRTVTRSYSSRGYRSCSPSSYANVHVRF